MKAYKAFSKDLTAKLGNHRNGVFQFESGKKYIEKECKCAKTGFHCAENPLCCLTYYNEDSRFFIVKAEGDINQDGNGSRISCTELTLIKEISLLEMGAYACQYIMKHPKRELESEYAVKNYGICKGKFLIVVGENPVAQGVNGSVLFFIKMKNEIVKSIWTIQIGEDEYKENTDYIMKAC